MPAPAPKAEVKKEEPKPKKEKEKPVVQEYVAPVEVPKFEAPIFVDDGSKERIADLERQLAEALELAKQHETEAMLQMDAAEKARDEKRAEMNRAQLAEGKLTQSEERTRTLEDQLKQLSRALEAARKGWRGSYCNEETCRGSRVTGAEVTGAGKNVGNALPRARGSCRWSEQTHR